MVDKITKLQVQALYDSTMNEFYYSEDDEDIFSDFENKNEKLIESVKKFISEEKNAEKTIKKARSSYEIWLKEQAEKEIDFVVDILGSKEKAIAFRDGKVTLSQLGAESPVTKTLKISQI